jgi:hypothetical protein
MKKTLAAVFMVLLAVLLVGCTKTMVVVAPTTITQYQPYTIATTTKMVVSTTITQYQTATAVAPFPPTATYLPSPYELANPGSHAIWVVQLYLSHTLGLAFVNTTSWGAAFDPTLKLWRVFNNGGSPLIFGTWFVDPTTFQLVNAQ